MEKNKIEYLLEKNILLSILPFLQNFHFNYVCNIIYILNNISIESDKIFGFYEKYNLFFFIFLNLEKFYFHEEIRKGIFWHLVCVLKFCSNLKMNIFEKILFILKIYLKNIKKEEDLLEFFCWFEYYLEDTPDLENKKIKILNFIKFDLNLKIKEILKFSKNIEILEIVTKMLINFSFFDKEIIDLFFYTKISENFIYLFNLENFEIQKNLLIISTNMIYIHNYYNFFFNKNFIEKIIFFIFHNNNENLNKEASYCLFNIVKGLKINNKDLKIFFTNFSILKEIFFFFKKKSFNDIILEILFILLKEIRSYNDFEKFGNYINFMKNHIDILNDLDSDEELLLEKVINLIDEL